MSLPVPAGKIELDGIELTSRLRRCPCAFNYAGDRVKDGVSDRGHAWLCMTRRCGNLFMCRSSGDMLSAAGTDTFLRSSD